MKKNRQQNESIKLYGSFSRQVKRIEGNLNWTEGDVVTPFGIVSTMTQNEPTLVLTRLDFAWKGRLYMRSYYHQYTERGVTILAGRFAKEIVKKN